MRKWAVYCFLLMKNIYGLLAVICMMMMICLVSGWATWWSFSEKVIASVWKASLPQSGVAHKVSWYARKVCCFSSNKLFFCSFCYLVSHFIFRYLYFYLSVLHLSLRWTHVWVPHLVHFSINAEWRCVWLQTMCSNFPIFYPLAIFLTVLDRYAWELCRVLPLLIIFSGLF